MSTMQGVYGTSVETAVPRATLVTALRGIGPLYSTEDLKAAPYIELHATTSARSTFTAKR